MKKWMIRILLLLVLAVGAVTLVGWSLPVGHTATREVTLSASPEAVYRKIQDVGQYPQWRDGVDRVEVLAASPLRWREHSGSDAITFETTQMVEGRVWTVRIADPDLPFGGTWTYRMDPVATGTRLQITEDGEVYNPIFRFVSRFVFGHTATIESYLEDLTESMR